MKKNITLLFSITLIISILLCACGNSASSTKATIIDNDGNTVQLSAQELISLEKENAAKFSSKYQTAQATILGTVESVDSHLQTFGTNTVDVYKINLQEGWSITVLEEFHKEVIDLEKGDKVEITSKIHSCFIDVEMYHVGQSGNNMYDKTIIKVQ